MASINLKVWTDIRENGILLDLKRDTSNEITISTIEEGRRTMTDSLAPRYSSMDELKVALEVWCIVWKGYTKNMLGNIFRMLKLLSIHQK